MAKRKDTTKAAMREMEATISKNNDISIKDGTDVTASEGDVCHFGRCFG